MNLRTFASWLRIILSILLLGALSACGAEAPPGSERLVGRWALDGASCEEAQLIYRDDGTWKVPGRSGRWTLDGDILTHRLTHWGEPGSGVGGEVSPPLCHSGPIRWEGANSAVTRWDDGTVHRLTRCDSRRRPTIRCLGDCAALTPFDWHGAAERPPASTRPCP